jgi:hypothetical protein
MRKLLMMAGVAALAASMPATAKPGGGKGDGGGPKAEHGGGPAKAHGGGHSGGQGGFKAHKAGGGYARQDMGGGKAEKRLAKAEKRMAKADKGWAKADRKAEKQWRKSEDKADRQFARQERGTREVDRRVYQDRRTYDGGRSYDDPRYASGSAGACPPGLARKNNGCLPPGQAKKVYGLGQRLPLGAYAAYNVPYEYRDWYGDNPEYSYRSDDGYIYRVDNQTNLVSALIPLLGGGFGVGSLLPAGYDTYNLPMQYRDDYYDTAEANYRYGDDAIYQVSPQSGMIESVVALLAGNLNVGQLLPSGYDTYNLPMDYRNQYPDSDDAMYRYADGNIYEVDPQSRMIEAIVAQLI